MIIDPTSNHGEGDPEAAERFNKAETEFAHSDRGKQEIQKGARVSAAEEAELKEAEKLGRERAKGDTAASR